MRLDAGTHELEIDIDGTGPPDFVCLHGLADTRAIWSRMKSELGARGRAILVDQRGHGGSGAPPGPCRREDLARDVIMILDRLGVERALVVGHSMGGIVAMTTAVEHPDRVAALVLIGTASQCNRRTADWYEAIGRSAEEKGLDGLREAIFGPKSERRIEGDAKALAEITRCLRSLYDDPLTPRLSAIACPVLLLVGSKDPMGAAASSILAQAIPHATLEVFPDRGHWLHVEAPDAVLDAVDRFLVRHRDQVGSRSHRGIR